MGLPRQAPPPGGPCGGASLTLRGSGARGTPNTHAISLAGRWLEAGLGLRLAGCVAGLAGLGSSIAFIRLSYDFWLDSGLLLGLGWIRRGVGLIWLDLVFIY